MVVPVPQRGFGAACHAGLLAATERLVCFMDADGSLDPADLPRVTARSAAARPTSCSAAAARHGRGAWPLHARLGNLAIADAVAAGPGFDCTTSARCAPPAATALIELGITDRRFGYPLEMVVRAAEAGWRIAELDVRLPPAHRPVQGHRHRRRHAAGRPRHAPGARGMTSGVRGMRGLRGQVVVIAKEPVPGRVKTRLTPPSPRRRRPSWPRPR